MRIEVPDAAAMVALGKRLGAHLSPGDAVCLTGPLGAGKTTLVRGVAVGMGVQATVVSPTFVIARRYPGPRGDLVHCDAYRLSDDDDFVDVVSDPESVVTIIEWGTPVMAALADSWLDIAIERSAGAGDEVRSVTFTGVGSQWDDGRVADVVRGSR
jgi:tRNA threonylcarbamoyladenosine biosynthesis protein TsaE